MIYSWRWVPLQCIHFHSHRQLHCTTMPPFIYSTVDCHLNVFVDVINKVSMCIFLVDASWCTCIRISLRYIPRIEFLDRRMWTCSNFLGNTTFPQGWYQFITLCGEESCSSASFPARDTVQLPNVCQSGKYELVHHWILISVSLILNRIKYLSYIYESFLLPFPCLCCPISIRLGLLHFSVMDFFF